MTDMEQLIERAQAVLDRLRSDPRDRPVFVEFAGTPKSGKSSCIEIVRHFFRRSDIKVLAPAGGCLSQDSLFPEGRPHGLQHLVSFLCVDARS